jgi:hypothetical protein
MDRLAQLVGYLGWLVGCYFGLLIAWKLWKRSRTKLNQNWTNFVSAFKDSKTPKRKEDHETSSVVPVRPNGHDRAGRWDSELR